MSGKERYRHMDKTNTTYEEYEKACYELAAQESDPAYAKEELDSAKEIKGIESLYNEKKSVASAVYLLCM